MGQTVFVVCAVLYASTLVVSWVAALDGPARYDMMLDNKLK